jgi:signal transduction histidine kinase
MLNVRRNALDGRPLIQFLAPASRPAVMQVLEQFRDRHAGHQLEKFDALLNAGPGAGLNVAIRVSVLPPQSSQRASIRWLFRDITDRHRDQQLLTQLNAELEARVADRTGQLDAALKKAQAASDTKDRFLAALSHELRTPLTPVMLALTQMERDAQIPPEIRRQLSPIRQHIELETRLIDDLLDISRIARGKIQLRKISLDVHEILRQAIDITLGPDILPDKGITLVTNFNAARSHAFADPARLTQVFCNLLQNALKFTPPRGTITISTNDLMPPQPDPLPHAPVPQDAQTIEGPQVGEPPDTAAAPVVAENLCAIAIQDTGIGIPAENVDSLFNVFEQGGPSITQRYGGLGLGLAISKAIVELHGGTIAAASPGRNQGSTFTVTLPTAAFSPSTVHAPPLAIWDGSAIIPAATQRLLLVEDHAATAKTLQKILQQLGFEVDVADSVRAGLQLAGKHAYHLIISDLGLPDGNGADLLQTLHTILPPPPTPAICLSGYGSDRDLLTTQNAGFLKHLTKPINVDELVGTIRSVLALKH